MSRNLEQISAGTASRSVSDRRVKVRPTTFAAVAGRSIRRTVSPERTLRDQVRNLRMAISDLTIQLSDLTAGLGRE